MKTQLIILLLFIVSCQEITNQENNFIATCTVSERLAICKIPITHQDSYAWNKTQTADGALEYRSNIAVSQYAFGFSLFKYPGSKEQKGSINQLFHDGQFSIWKEEEYSGSVLRGHSIVVGYFEPYIGIKISDTSTIQLLFKDRPSTCSFNLTGFKASELEGAVEIIYE